MNTQIKIFYPDNSSTFEFVDRLPDQCPMCHYHITPTYISAHFPKIESKNFKVIFRCPSKDCFRFFISNYVSLKYEKSLPQFPEKPSINEEVNKISIRFFNIYTQALAAKAYELPELVSIGFRKALEILIKDFCISKNAAEIDKIKNLTLHDCINSYSDGKVQKCVNACRVLGNDETHYERKYEDKDIDDLEKLLQVTLHWIEAEIISDSV